MTEKYQKVQHVNISSEDAGRRIDNFLFRHLKQVPKTRIYRMLRKGEVRLNGRRVRQDQKLTPGDVVRIPPARVEELPSGQPPAYLVRRIEDCIIHEDGLFIAINKPAGISVHSGSRDPYGVIEALRFARPDEKNLQLAHRLDRMTSGCLLFCKRTDTLRLIHRALRDGQVSKKYLALVKGKPQRREFRVDAALSKGHLQSGERMVEVTRDGKQAQSVFRVVRQFGKAALTEVELLTGRTHQIRVHAVHAGHPLALDRKYGDSGFNNDMKALGLKRMFLHSSTLAFRLPDIPGPVRIKAELPDELEDFLEVPGL